MADTKIDDLTEVTIPLATDVLAIVQQSTNETKKITVQNLRKTVFSSDSDRDLDAEISAIGATETTLYIDSTAEMSENVTIPSTLSIKVLKGGYIDQSTYTLDINGSFEAGAYQVFTGSGTVTFGSGSTKEILPEWWGIDGTDDDVQIGLALAAGSTNKIPVRLTQAYTFGGSATVPVNSYLFSTTHALLTADSAMDSTFFTITGGNIVIDGLYFDGNSAAQTGGNYQAIYCDTASADDVTIRNCSFYDIYGVAVHMEASATDWKITNNTFTDCGQETRAAVAFGLAGTETFQNIEISHNYVENCGMGFQVYHPSTGSITDVKINDNTVKDTTLIGIEVNAWGASRVIIANNMVSGSGTHGISAATADHQIVANNVIRDQTSSGIEGPGPNYNIITGNEIYNCAHGIVNAAQTGNDPTKYFEITNNLIDTTTSGTNFDGIRLDQVVYENGKISGNYVRNPYTSGIVVTGTGTLGDVSNITISDNLVLFDSARAAGQRTTGIKVYDMEYCSILNNTIITSVEESGQTFYGLLQISRESKHLDIIGNILKGSGSIIQHTGIVINLSTQADYTRILNNTLENLYLGINSSEADESPHIEVLGNHYTNCTTNESTDASHKTDLKSTSPTKGSLWYVGDRVWETAPSGSGVPGWVCVKRVATEVKVAGSATDTSLDVDDTTGMAAGDIIGVELDSGAWHWTTIASITDGDTLVLTAGLAGDAAVDNDVVVNLWKDMANLAA